MAKRPYESRVQNLVYTLEVGIGAQILKTLLYVLFMMLLAVLFVATQYTGFNQPRSMDQAQLARRFSENGRLHTGHIRPASLALLSRNDKLTVPAPDGGARARIHDHPDLIHAPLYPLVLGSAFKLFRTDFELPTTQRFTPEQWVIIPLNLLFCFLTALFVYLIGRLLFDARTALTGTTIFFLANIIWVQAVAGNELSLAMLLAAIGFWCLVLAIRAARLLPDTPAPRDLRFWIPALGGAAAMALLFLTRYAAFAAFPGYLMALWIGAGKRGWLPALASLLLFSAILSPWLLRNLDASGTLFGLAPHTAIQDANDSYMRSLAYDMEALDLRRHIQARFLRTFPNAINLGAFTFSAGITFALFISTFFYGFQRPATRILRWGLLLSFSILTLTAGVFGEELFEVAQIFLPLVILFGSAFFFILIDRMQIGVRIVSMSIIALFILLQATPMLFNIMPPRPWSYPPYSARQIGWITSPFQDHQLIVSDMPWATAWYSGATSMRLPLQLDEFFEIHDHLHPISGMYLTSLTTDKRYLTDFIRGPYAQWEPLLRNQQPRGFPLPVFFHLDREHFVFADRNYWTP